MKPSLILIIVFSAVGAATHAGTLTEPILPGSITIRLDNFSTVPSSSGGLLSGSHAGDSRLFVEGQRGVIHILQDGRSLDTPFLDLADVTDINLIVGNEAGLLGLAFHPNYGSPGMPGEGLMYTFSSESKIGHSPDFFHPELGSAGGALHNVIREWSVDAVNPNLIDNSSSRVLMRVQSPSGTHNAGALVFGPDENLYISIGDGGCCLDHNF